MANSNFFLNYLIRAHWPKTWSCNIKHLYLWGFCHYLFYVWITADLSYSICAHCHRDARDYGTKCHGQAG